MKPWVSPADSDLRTEYGVRMREGGSVEPVPSRQVGERLVANDPRRALFSRLVTDWAEVGGEG